MPVLRCGALYFALVFAAGFVLGPVRLFWLVPRVGERMAELIEMPIMLVVIILAARWIARRPSLPPTRPARLGVGLVALALLLGAEFGVVLGLRGLTIAEYFANRDPVSGTVYTVMLAALAAMPLLLAPGRVPLIHV
jgi:MFS family permease